jgi:hypothetical protein
MSIPSRGPRRMSGDGTCNEIAPHGDMRPAPFRRDVGGRARRLSGKLSMPIYRTSLPIWLINFLTTIAHIRYHMSEAILLVPVSWARKLWVTATTRRTSGGSRILTFEKSGRLPTVPWEQNPSPERKDLGERPQACPNYDSVVQGRPAAPPLALRKGSAFPVPEGTHRLPLRRRRGWPSGAANVKNHRRWAGKAEPFPGVSTFLPRCRPR